MPTYDYVCQNCSHAFEEFQSITASPLKKCPSCGKLKLKRLIGTGAGIIFKGSGFYQTDYRSESYTKGAGADTGSGAPAAKSGDTATKETKAETPQTKSETKTEVKTDVKTETKTESVPSLQSKPEQKKKTA